MALGDGTGWNTSAPANTDLRSVGAAEIRDLRTGVGIRIDKEHVALSSSSAGGEHKEGSAVIYDEPDSRVSFPTKKPDGSTSLDSADVGRLLLQAGKLYMYNGTVFTWGEASSGSRVISSSYDAWINVGRPFRILVFSHSAGNNGIILFNGIGNQTLRFMDVVAGSSDNDDRLEFKTEQDETDPTDVYRFDVKSVNITGTWSYTVLF